jgi:hypothetical protein
MERIASILIAAHFCGDFLLQPDLLVKRKSQSGFLLLHAAIHGLLAYGLLQVWQCWELPLYVFLVHASIDFVKQGQRDTGAYLDVVRCGMVACLSCRHS